MNLLAEIRARFHQALAPLVADVDGLNVDELLSMIRPSQDPKFGDYQANCAMPLKAKLNKSPRDIAAQIVENLDVADMCDPPEIAGPGFINLRLSDGFLNARLNELLADKRIGVPSAPNPRTYVIDYSAPNVAKPMHVGHIRSTAIGQCLYRTLKFLGHNVIGDNHIGDWGTQFGMIIYGYKHLLNEQAFEQDMVAELARLYRTVNQLVDYHRAVAQLPKLQDQLTAQQRALEQATATANETTDKAQAKKLRKELKQSENRIEQTQDDIESAEKKIAAIEENPVLKAMADSHPDIGKSVLEETAKLHSGDAENVALWERFVPPCMVEIERTYQRLGVSFDHTLGESFYHEQLPGVVEAFRERGLARESEGAMCVFLDGFSSPMIIQKQDGAFLYATTDLATIDYRMKTWSPDEILYVVDHRQSEHFQKLFAAERLWGYDKVGLKHVSFGTVLGKDGKPFKTREGTAAGLEGLLNSAVSSAFKVVSENDEAKPQGPELSPEVRQQVAEIVGIGAIIYADLSHNRESDYEYDEAKMLATTGNTATYMQYAYARVQSIFRKGGIDISTLQNSGAQLNVGMPQERALAMEILRFPEALDYVVEDYRPNQLTNYLFDQLARQFSQFFEHCPVLKADDDATRDSRALLCELTGRTLKQGLHLLGIQVAERM